MKKIFKFVLLALGLRYVLRLMDENVETDDLENKLKDFFKKYDPKFKDQEENQEDF